MKTYKWNTVTPIFSTSKCIKRVQIGNVMGEHWYHWHHKNGGSTSWQPIHQFWRHRTHRTHRTHWTHRTDSKLHYALLKEFQGIRGIPQVFHCIPLPIHRSCDGARPAAVKVRRLKLVAVSKYLTRQLFNMLKSLKSFSWRSWSDEANKMRWKETKSGESEMYRNLLWDFVMRGAEQILDDRRCIARIFTDKR